MNNYKTPGVYIEEIRRFPPSVAQVETAIPVFIGYTSKARQKEDGDLLNKAHRIVSTFEYERFFGEPFKETGITVTIDSTQAPIETNAKITNPSPYMMYHGVQAFYTNGGGPCYIISVGNYDTGVVDLATLQAALAELEKVDEVTLIVFPDGQGLSSGDYYALQKEAMDQCAKLKDRFTVMDVWIDPNDDTIDNVDVFRNEDFGTIDVSKYGAAYYPRIFARYDYQYEETAVNITLDGAAMTLADLKSANNAMYNRAKAAINNLEMEMPASPSIVGVYARVDNNRGVWKAPANEGIDFAIRPSIKITDEDQESLNVDVNAGKSINAIRSFTGRGPAIIWGARTLAGNDNEWRYVSVRRFFNMVEESVKKATVQFVFEPNDINTWTRVKSMIENFLTLQWRAGALMGTTPQEAYFVKVGLNETMSEVDIWEGRMIVEIGMAVVRPAEFIILRFSHKMLEEN